MCNHNPETSVLCHKGGAGMALKTDDRIAAIGCSDCHAAVDRKGYMHLPLEYVRLCHYEGIFRTQQIWIAEGLM